MSSFENGECTSCTNNKCSQFGNYFFKLLMKRSLIISNCIIKYKGYYSDQYKGRGSMYFLTLGTSEFCGIQYLAKIKISSQSNKTAGELVISFNNESVSLTSKDQELTANMEIKKLFIIKTDIKSGSSVSIKWNKKPKSFFQFTDPNAPNLVYDSIQLIHLSESET
jgi:hypothetical protein